MSCTKKVSAKIAYRKIILMAIFEGLTDEEIMQKLKRGPVEQVFQWFYGDNLLSYSDTKRMIGTLYKQLSNHISEQRRLIDTFIRNYLINVLDENVHLTDERMIMRRYMVTAFKEGTHPVFIVKTLLIENSRKDIGKILLGDNIDISITPSDATVIVRYIQKMWETMYQSKKSNKPKQDVNAEVKDAVLNSDRAKKE